MLGASLVESAIWAATYVAIGAFDGFEPALYFSVVTYTTLGYGDITPHEGWRLVAALQAATGIVMFGWTMALLLAVAQRLAVQRGYGKCRPRGLRPGICAPAQPIGPPLFDLRRAAAARRAAHLRCPHRP